MTESRRRDGRSIPLRPVLGLFGGLVCASPLAAQDGYIETDGARLYYRIVGQGNPILVLHGGPGMEHTYLLPGLEVLASANRLVFYDQRGTGRSEGAVDSTTIDLDRFLADIETVRNDLGLGRVALMAHSWAGLLGISFALRHPERLSALILVNSGEPGTRFEQAATAAQASRRAESDAVRLAELAGSDGLRNRDTATINEIYRVAFRSSFADPANAGRLEINFTERTARNGSDVARILMTPLQGLDLWPRLRELRVPVLVLHGEADVMPAEMPRALADSIPDSELALIPGAGHFPWIENPAAFRAAIRTFLDRLGEGGAT